MIPIRRTMRPAASLFVSSVLALVGTTAYFAWAPGAGASLTFWLLAAGPSVVLAAVATVWAARDDLLGGWLEPRWGDITRGIVGAALLYAAALAFARMAIGSSREIWLVSFYGQIGDPRRLRLHAPAVGATVLIVCACEEILWRGMVTQLLADRFGSRSAWVAAAALYALAYVPTMWALRTSAGLNPILVAAAFAGGLLWGAMARVFGSLVPSLIAHVFFDWVALMVIPLWPGRFEL